jgi:hypothetical protein
VLLGVDLLDGMQVTHNDSTLRLSVMDSVFLYGTSAAGISVYELDLAKGVYAILSVVIVNLFTAILLEMVVDVCLEVVAVVHHHTTSRAVNNLVEAVIVVSV